MPLGIAKPTRQSTFLGQALRDFGDTHICLLAHKFYRESVLRNFANNQNFCVDQCTETKQIPINLKQALTLDSVL